MRPSKNAHTHAHNSKADCDTILSAYTMYRHLEKYRTQPWIYPCDVMATISGTRDRNERTSAYEWAIAS